MWKWLKNFINNIINKNERQKVLDYSKMNLGDLKKLKAQGKIKDIYPPYK